MIFKGVLMSDSKDKSTGGRRLSKAEIERTEAFKMTSSDLESNGYVLKDLTATAVQANVLGIVMGGALSAPFIAVFFITGKWNGEFYSALQYAIVLVCSFVSIIIHELIHGTSWAIFLKDHFKNIAFGVAWEALMPYCTCKVPMRRGPYVFGLLMPCITLGVVPGIVSIVIGSSVLLFYSAIMIVSAGGDLLIFMLVIRSKLKGDVLFLDHPTEVGLVAFVKEK